jgi:hypothetical protein
MTTISESIDDATRSRLARVMLATGGGKRTLYAVTEKNRPQLVVVIVSTCAEEALKLIRAHLELDWRVGNTTTRSIQRNVDADPQIISAFKLNHTR